MGRGKRKNTGAGRSNAAAAASRPLGDDAIVKRLDNPPASKIARDPSLIVLVGVSGAGKDTLIKLASEQRRLRKPISATTRAARVGERDGVDYHFLSREEFMQRVAQGEMFEWEEFSGNCYGTLLSELHDEGLKLTIKENKGAITLKERLGAIVIGVFPPSLDAVRERLLERGDDPEEVRKRIEIDKIRAEEILGFADYIVRNDDLKLTDARFIALLDELGAR
jgi:guanylate kinase